MVLAPCLVLAVVGLVTPRPRVLVALTVVICAVLIANAIAANTLTSALTI
jgi:hypothetical protein